MNIYLGICPQLTAFYTSLYEKNKLIKMIHKLYLKKYTRDEAQPLNKCEKIKPNSLPLKDNKI